MQHGLTPSQEQEPIIGYDDAPYMPPLTSEARARAHRDHISTYSDHLQRSIPRQPTVEYLSGPASDPSYTRRPAFAVNTTRCGYSTSDTATEGACTSVYDTKKKEDNTPTFMYKR